MLARLWALTFFVAVATDAMSGAIRYYTSLVGLAELAYLPKVMMLGCIVVIVANGPKVSHLFAAMFIAVQTCVSLSNGHDLAAVGFWSWTMLPVIFAAMAPLQALEMLNMRVATVAFALLIALCGVGILTNYFFTLPWPGTSATVGGVDVQVALAAYTGDGVRRLSGFGRGSASTGLTIGLLATWLLPRVRSLAFAVVMLAGAGAAIWGTTNKTTLVSLMLVVALYSLTRVLSARKVCMWTAAVAIVFPLAVCATIVTHGTTLIQAGPFFSFEDRIFNTWPLMLEGMIRENLVWLGLGPGGFGASTLIYPNDAGFNVLDSDNMALYVIATFGIFGAILGLLLLVKLLVSREPEGSPVWIMLFFLLSSGVTTDIFESIGCLLFLGVTAKALWIGGQGTPVHTGHSYAGSPYRRDVTSVIARRQ